MGSEPARARAQRALGEAQRAAIGMPKAVARMNQKADRRGMDRLGALRPSLERQERRPAKGKQRVAAEFARESPSITRRLQRSSGWSQAVARLGRSAKAPQPSRPAIPASTIVRISASAPAARPA